MLCTKSDCEFYCFIKGIIQAPAVWVLVTLCFKTLRGLQNVLSPISTTSAELVPIATPKKKQPFLYQRPNMKSDGPCLLMFVAVKR